MRSTIGGCSVDNQNQKEACCLTTGETEAGLAALAAAAVAVNASPACLTAHAPLGGAADGAAVPTQADPAHQSVHTREVATRLCELGGAFLSAGRRDDAQFCLQGGCAADAWAPAVHTLGAQLAEVSPVDAVLLSACEVAPEELSLIFGLVLADRQR